MREVILSRLSSIEKEHNVTILYACESGSRIWGFESKDSDWDIRFIYTRKPAWYTSVSRLNNIGGVRDVIEYELEKETNLDINGWDLSKALLLLYKSNCPLLEWLNTTLIYYSNPEFYKEITNLSTRLYSRKRALYHYYHMTNGNIKDYLEYRDIVWTKKYIYILRTLLACMWIMDRTDPIPVRLQDLVSGIKNHIDSEVCNEIDSLLEKKIRGDELGKEPKNEVLNQFIFSKSSEVYLSMNGFKEENNQSLLPELDAMMYKWSVQQWH